MQVEIHIENKNMKSKNTNKIAFIGKDNCILLVPILMKTNYVVLKKPSLYTFQKKPWKILCTKYDSTVFTWAVVTVPPFLSFLQKMQKSSFYGFMYVCLFCLFFDHELALVVIRECLFKLQTFIFLLHLWSYMTHFCNIMTQYDILYLSKCFEM